MSVSDRRFLGRRWPDETQLLLLKAALLQGDAATQALREWEERVDIERLSNASYALLPLLYFASQKQGIEPREKGRMRGLYRRTWFQNQAALARASKVLCALHSSGIDTMVLKGTALMALGLFDPGARPMTDVDIMVPTSKASEARQALEALGLSPTLPLPGDLQPLLMRLHSWEMSDGPEVPIDLHWHLLGTSLFPGADEEFWAGARDVIVGNVRTTVPASSDLLMHLIAHGCHWTPVPSFRWIADCVAVLRSDTAIDWDRFCRLVEQHTMALPAQRGLAYISTHFDVEVPPEALGRLASFRPGPVERAYYALQGAGESLPTAVLKDSVRYVFATRGQTAGQRIRGYWPHLRLAWQVPGLAQLPAWLIGKARRRFGRSRLRRYGVIRESDASA